MEEEGLACMRKRDELRGNEGLVCKQQLQQNGSAEAGAGPPRRAAGVRED